MQNNDMIVQFWGVRGNLPVPGKETIRYGGNTNCVTLNIANKHWFIFDAGSGIKKFAEYLGDTKKNPFAAKLFISHPHWDHINALPHFDPLYVKGNQLEVFSGCPNDTTVEKLIFGQMDNVYYPVTVAAMAATLTYRKLQPEESFTIDNISIQTMRLNHHGICLGYRVQYADKVFCYITDNELPLKDDPAFDSLFEERLIKFTNKADVLVIDSTYTDEEYLEKKGWGHSSISQVVNIADKAKVKKLCLFHHCPIQKDGEIDAKVKAATLLLKKLHSTTKCLAPGEDDQLNI